MYTIHDPERGRDLRLERGLGELESRFVPLRQRLEDGGALSKDEQFLMCAFTAAMSARSRARRDYMRRQWSAVLEKMKRFEAQMERLAPEDQIRFSKPMANPADTFSIEEIEVLAKAPHQIALIPMIESELEFMAQMTFTILEAPEGSSFLTTDTPCLFFDKEIRNRPFPYNTIGLGYDTVEITLPLSPRLVLFLSWQDVPERITVPRFAVEEINRKARFQCKEHFINCRDHVHPYWFDPRLDLAPQEPRAMQIDLGHK